MKTNKAHLETLMKINLKNSLYIRTFFNLFDVNRIAL